MHKKYLLQDENILYLDTFKQFIKLINEIEYFENNNFIKVHVSIFDHWLNENEASTKINTYAILIDELENNFEFQEKNIELFSCYIKNEYQFLKWFIYLYCNYKIIHFDHEKIKFFQYENLNYFLNACYKSLREESFINIYVLELECLIVGNYDLTLPIYSKNNDKFQELVTTINQFNLHII